MAASFNLPMISYVNKKTFTIKCVKCNFCFSSARSKKLQTSAFSKRLPELDRQIRKSQNPLRHSYFISTGTRLRFFTWNRTAVHREALRRPFSRRFARRGLQFWKLIVGIIHVNFHIRKKLFVSWLTKLMRMQEVSLWHIHVYLLIIFSKHWGGVVNFAVKRTAL